jgi:hypothetical protein
MSIEALIQAHTEALLANTEALLANTEAVKLLTLSLAGRTPKAETKPMVHDVKALEAAHKPAAKFEEKKEEPKAEEVVEELQAGSEAVPYETVRALVLKLAPTQRDAIKAINANHGIANLKVLLDKEDDFSTVNDQAKLEAVYADLQALEA